MRLAGSPSCGHHVADDQIAIDEQRSSSCSLGGSYPDQDPSPVAVAGRAGTDNEAKATCGGRVISETTVERETAARRAGGPEKIEEDEGPSWRSAQTRQAILDSAKQLFLERGYAGTRIHNITDACGVSRAGFYTYFKDKREIFLELGTTTYREVLEAVGAFSRLPDPCTQPAMEQWVRRYFSFMDDNGALMLSSTQNAPQDEQYRATARSLQLRPALLLGAQIHHRQPEPVGEEAAVGAAVMAMLERSWFLCRVSGLAVGEDDMIGSLAQMICIICEGRAAGVGDRLG